MFTFIIIVVIAIADEYHSARSTLVVARSHRETIRQRKRTLAFFFVVQLLLITKRSTPIRVELGRGRKRHYS